MERKQKNLTIRNSTAEFLIFTSQDGKNSIEARFEDETIWLTQKLMGELFEVGTNTINYHLKEIFKSGEIEENAVIRKFRITADDGKNYNTNFYNLDAIISVGYRVNSLRATQFRQWATKILKTDVSIAKNYLTKNELESLGRIVNAYLDLAEERAKRQIPMTMQDWAKRLDLFLEYDDRSVLQNAGEITTQIAKDHAETEFEKYRIIQDRLFQSDFDKEITKLLKNDDKNT